MLHNHIVSQMQIYCVLPTKKKKNPACLSTRHQGAMPMDSTHLIPRMFPTGLGHLIWLKLVGSTQVSWLGRKHMWYQTAKCYDGLLGTWNPILDGSWKNDCGHGQGTPRWKGWSIRDGQCITLSDHLEGEAGHVRSSVHPSLVILSTGETGASPLIWLNKIWAAAEELLADRVRTKGLFDLSLDTEILKMCAILKINKLF